MEIQQIANIRNKFKIEVRDANTNKIKQEGQAYNLIMDRVYNQICSFNSYFTNILFGRGSGEIDPSRTTLFDRIGYKAATVKETSRGYPTSYVTKTIQLAPEEFVGESITEVGISEHATNINTHALIRDAEGNPLVINKTDTDIIIIHATVFITLEEDRSTLRFTQIKQNQLITYFLEGGAVANTIQADEYFGESIATGSRAPWTTTATRTALPAEKKIRWYGRFPVGMASGEAEISWISLANCCRLSLPDITFSSWEVAEKLIGIGDGVTTEFEIPNRRISDLAVKVDGNKVTNYETTNYGYYLYNLPGNFATKSYLAFVYSEDPLIIILAWTVSAFYASSAQYALFIDLETETVYQQALDADSPGGDYGNFYSLKRSVDGQYLEYTIRGNSTRTIQYRLDGDRFVRDTIPSGIEMITHNMLDPNSIPPMANNIVLGKIDDIPVKRREENIYTKIIFDTPPAENKEVRATYTVPYIPKTSDYVLDVTFEVVFGEGV